MLIAFLFDTVGRYLRYRLQIASMVGLDDRTLSDIGLNRSELRAVARRTASHWAQRLSTHTPSVAKKARANAGLDLCSQTRRQCLISGGSLPPFATSFAITCLCSQIFMLAESLLSPA